jgi:hypothetical protein
MNYGRRKEKLESNLAFLVLAQNETYFKPFWKNQEKCTLVVPEIL